MGLSNAIIEHMSETANNYSLKRVQAGLIYSAVQLDNNATGVAYTFPMKEHCGPGMRRDRKPLAGRKAAEIITYLGDKNLIMSSLALAAVNALLASRKLPEDVSFGDVLDNLDIRNGDQVCMVGSFLPLLPALEKRQVKVFSVDEAPKPHTGPPEDVEQLLSESQVAIITGTAIINNTIDRMLALARTCREVAILGASTPLLKEAFADTSVTCLSGIRVTEPEKVFQTIGEGAGFREFRKYVRKVNLRLK